jgi:hypothetical protein
MNSLTPQEKSFLESLSSPQKIQNYLESIPFNHEESGETCTSPRVTLRTKRAHCMEGALLACAALWLQKREPYIISLRVTGKDYDHVVAIYEEQGYFGAISKTNHAVLGFRDPVYKTIRELAMSYFHEYFLVTNGEKTMRGYSRRINLQRFGKAWITSEENLFDIAEAIYDTPHISIIPPGNENLLRKATSFERKHADVSVDGI